MIFYETSISQKASETSKQWETIVRFSTQKQPQEVFYKKSCSKTPVVESLFDKVAELKVSNFIEKRLQHSNAGVFLWILWNFYKHLFWKTSANSWVWILSYGSVSLFLKKNIVAIEEITFSIDPSHWLMSIECVIHPVVTRKFWSESDSRPSKCTGS